MKHAIFALAFGATGLLAPAASASDVTFHFYGAENCLPCLAFKRNNLDDVRAKGAEVGFDVVENMVPTIRDVPVEGSYGAADPLLRKAATELVRTYPPIFFVTDGDAVISVHGGNWRGALQSAEERAGS